MEPPKNSLSAISRWNRNTCGLIPGSNQFGARIPDLNVVQASFGILLNVDVDGKVSVDVTHLVQEALGDTDDHVVDDRTDSTEGSDTLADTVVHLNGDDILLGAAEGDGDVREVLNKLACKGAKETVSVTKLLTGDGFWRGIEICIPRGPSTVTIRERM